MSTMSHELNAEAVETLLRQQPVDRIDDAADATAASTAAAHTYVTREGGPGIAYRIRITSLSGRHSLAGS